MKLVTFNTPGNTPGGQRIGALVEGGVAILDLDAAHQARYATRSPVFRSMQSLIDAGEPALDQARSLLARMPISARVEAGSVTLLSPLPQPMQMRDFLCFETHMRQAGDSVVKLQAMAKGEQPGETPPIPDVWYRQPIYYKCNRFAVAGTGADVVWPAYSRLMDYELELAIVIGRRGRDIAKSDARDHIFGYTIFNDFTARDAQAAEMAGPLGPAKGKDFDGANILGPCIVTRDEIDDPYALDMVARVNGEPWSRGNSSSIHWTFEDMIAHVSQAETLHPGEVLGSGTVGNGCGLELMRFLAHGDVVELEISSIGTLRNRVLAPHVAA